VFGDRRPKVKISNVDIVGNKVFGDGKVRGRMKTNKGGGFWIFPGSSIYQEDKFEEDAQMIVDFYRERGYLQVNVGQPNLKHLRDSDDGKTRFMTLEIPVSEGARYRVDKFEFAGNDKVPADVMRPLFKLKSGDYYNEKRLRQGFEKIREIYGSGGHFEMTPFPEFDPVGDKVNVTIRINEGKQYVVNRITFQGNTTTRDSVIRRELRLYENGVFNTEALKYSVKRLNQLGYFGRSEDQKNITIDKTPGADNKVDVASSWKSRTATSCRSARACRA
jgi:outer membrane protein insertion porin family